MLILHAQFDQVSLFHQQYLRHFFRNGIDPAAGIPMLDFRQCVVFLGIEFVQCILQCRNGIFRLPPVFLEGGCFQIDALGQSNIVVAQGVEKQGRKQFFGVYRLQDFV